MKRKISLFGVLALLATTVAFAPAAKSAEQFAVPTAPKITKTTVFPNGILIKWDPVVAQPEINTYVVSGGPGSCPIYISPNKGYMQAILPVMPGQTSVIPTVQAVNAYGISAASKAKEIPASALTNVSRRSDLKVVQLNQLSDFHGALEGTATNAGAAILATAFANDRKLVPATFTLSSGDNFGAAPVISSEFEEIPSVEAMNLMKFDISTFGNHEHDREMAHIVKMINLSNFKWVVSNYSTIAPLNTGANKVATYQILERGGVRLGVVGVNTPETVDVVSPGNLANITITSDPKPVNQAIADAKAAGAEFVVVLNHQGWSENRGGAATGELIKSAASYKGASVVFGGHSHLQYNSISKNSRTAPAVTLAQVANSGAAYNQVSVCVRDGKVVGTAVNVVTAASISKLTPDATTAAMVKKYKDQVSAKLDVKIGQVSGIFPRGGTPAVERSGETEMGNYMADLVRAATKTQITILNGGGIRDTFPAKTYTPADKTLVRPSTSTTGPYDVTLGDALTVFPFGNYIATTKMTGADVWKAIENGVSQFPTAGRFPQISGFKFSFDPTKAVGSRVTSIKTLDGKDIPNNSSVEFTAATVDFMVSGGDGYVDVFHPQTAKIGGLLVDVLVAGLKADLAAGKVTQLPKLDGRIAKP
jgi:2',3'-cyclic-nucleotide 2'-phosphodiesterase (5'-nucleotidase family)